MLGDLVKLDVSHNKFSGSIPGELGQLRKLESLRMERNSFTGNFAIGLGRMSALRIWYLEYNALSGLFPNAVVLALTNLQEFSIVGNDITGTVADAFCRRGLEVFGIDCRALESRCWTKCLVSCSGSSGVTCKGN